MITVILVGLFVAFFVAGWGWGAAQTAYRLSRDNAVRIGELENKFMTLGERVNSNSVEEEEPIRWFCSACTREIDEDESVEIQIDLPMNPESTVLLPVTIELCKECASLGTQA